MYVPHSIIWFIKMINVDTLQKREMELAISGDDVDEETLTENFSDGLSMTDTLVPSPGGPFSALTSSMWPQDIMAKQSIVPDDPNAQPEYRYFYCMFYLHNSSYSTY